MELLNTFIDTLKELLEERELTIARFARLTGCHRKAVSNWFSGKFYPKAQTLVKIADFFGCSIDYLFGLTDSFAFTPASAATAFMSRYDLLKEKSGKTDYAVAKYCGIGESAISKWRRFGNYPETRTLLKLCELFGCTFEYLAGRSDD